MRSALVFPFFFRVPYGAALALALMLTACGPNPPSGPTVPAPPPGSELVFLAVGRQGYGDRASRQVAVAMDRVAREHGNVSFSLLLGDNFYPTGVTSVDDGQWDDKFESLYDGPHLRGMPFYAILGNHDHQGNVAAQLAYSKQGLGNGRWTMKAPHYAEDFGEVDGRPLARIVFLDSVPLHGIGTEGPVPPASRTHEAQMRLLRDAFPAEAPEPHWRIVASHYSARSRTGLEYSAARVMPQLLPILRETGIDLYLSVNDRFQQVLDVPGEPLHVGTNGGGRKIEEIASVDEPAELVVSQRGFALISIDAEGITVELFDADGELSHTRERKRANR